MNTERPPATSANLPLRRVVHVDLPEDVVGAVIAVLRVSDAPVKETAIPILTAALHAQRSAHIAGPKRLAVFHAFCELWPEAQTVVADLVFWLRAANPRSRRQLKASLDALAQLHHPQQQ